MVFQELKYRTFMRPDTVLLCDQYRTFVRPKQPKAIDSQ
jgi:hypothetical protein